MTKSSLGVPLDRDIKLDRSDLDFFGRMLVRFIREEAKKDSAKSSFIPDNRDFYGSFSYHTEGNQVVVTSDWPWIELIVQGTPGPFPMKWLTKAQGVAKVPLRDKEGVLVIRSTPLTTDKAWIHPKIAQHSFIQRAFDRARGAFASRVVERNLGSILGGVFKTR